MSTAPTTPSPNVPQGPSSLPVDRSAVETEYAHMISFFKWLVSITALALGIIVAAGLTIFYKDMSQVRDQAGAAITETRDSAGRDIAKVRADAQSAAIEEAHKSIDEAFQTQNVQSMLNAAARREVGPAIDRRVREEVDRAMVGFDQAMSNLEEIADLGMRMRIGLREGLDGLLLKTKTAATDKDRMRAKNILESISRDYEKARRNEMHEGNFADAHTYFLAYVGMASKAIQPKAGACHCKGHT